MTAPWSLISLADGGLADLFAVTPITVPWLGVLLVVVGFPLADVAMFRYNAEYRRLFSERDPSAFTAAYVRMTTLRWLNAGVAVLVLANSDAPLSAVGVTLPRPWLTGASLVVAVLVAAAYAVVVLGADPVSADTLSNREVTSTPKTRHERIVWFATAGVTAGVSEEFVYRGFAIAALAGLGLPAWAAVLGASLSFVFAHGTITYHHPPLFPVYLGIGVAFSLLYLAAGSLLPMVVLHAAFNLAQTTQNYANGFQNSASAESSAT